MEEKMEVILTSADQLSYTTRVDLENRVSLLDSGSLTLTDRQASNSSSNYPPKTIEEGVWPLPAGYPWTWRTLQRIRHEFHQHRTDAGIMWCRASTRPHPPPPPSSPGDNFISSLHCNVMINWSISFRGFRRKIATQGSWWVWKNTKKWTNFGIRAN